MSGTLPSAFENVSTACAVASLVSLPRTTSTSFISGTGFMKCMPITRSARFVLAASIVIEIDDVLLARIAFAGSAWSAAWNTFVLTSRFSVTASMQRSTLASTDMSVPACRLFFARSAASAVSVPFSTSLPRLLCTFATPRSRNSLPTSIRCVFTPLVAKTCAMPLPIVPAPITATAAGRVEVLIRFRVGCSFAARAGALSHALHALHAHDDRVAAAEAQARKAARLAVLLQRVQQRDQHTRARGADRMAEGDGAAVH